MSNNHDFFTNEELLASEGDVFLFDIECYPNYFLIAFKSNSNGKVVTFEKSPDSDIDFDKLSWVLWHHLLVSYNGNNYDLPLVTLALTGATCDALKTASDALIGGMRRFEFEKKYQIKPLEYLNHIDLFELVPGKLSLKLLAGRLGAKWLQDLPFDPSLPLSNEQAKFVYDYCINDLENTKLLLLDLEDSIKLRYKLSSDYSMDLRSKSDAQIAEAVISKSLENIIGYKPKRPMIHEGALVKYNIPDNIKFKSKSGIDILSFISDYLFSIADDGSPELPKELEAGKFTINDKCYSFQIGGLHSCEKSQAEVACDNFIIVDADVTSYYPSIILNQGLYPKQCTSRFLSIYESIVDARIKAKKQKDTLTSDTLKIVINGSYGKFGSKFSLLYSPDLLLQVTLTGQLSLLMLIERLEFAGISVISANTDGIVSKIPKDLKDTYVDIISDWQNETGFRLEFKNYKALYSRDVNNYIAVQENGELKLKGCYGKASISKNPSFEICSEAVCELITKGIPLSDTIYNCKDILKFCIVRTVNGGAKYKDGYVGKVVRFYISKTSKDELTYVTSGNKVPLSSNCVPLMELGKDIEPIDYEFYISTANDILYDIGYKKKRKSLL